MSVKFPGRPDFEQFLRVLRREKKPAHLPFYEHFTSLGFVSRRLGVDMARVPPGSREYWGHYVDFWMGMGYDCVPMEISPNFATGERHNALSEGSEALVVIRNREDFDNYRWPTDSDPIDFSHFETVASLLPDGAKIVGGVGAGPYEWVSWLMGTIELSYAMADDPELVDLVFKRMGRVHVNAVRQLAQMDAVGALRQGDDLGFKTATFLCPDDLRKWVFPTYKQMVDLAHAAGKPFILHSCGNLSKVYPDLIDDVGIDAKHSFEDVIMPVAEFKKLYGDRVTPVGGMDVDLICRSSQADIRRHTRKMIEDCFSDGWWALGTGNSLTDYMPVENYLAVLEEGINVTG